MLYHLLLSQSHQSGDEVANKIREINMVLIGEQISHFHTQF